jgi:hypothetical protein
MGALEASLEMGALEVRPPKVEMQGRAIVEPGEGGGYIVMLPNGAVRIRATPTACLKVIREYSRTHGSKYAIRALTVEWRDGAEPPAEILVAEPRSKRGR